jgi:hypothetical protein
MCAVLVFFLLTNGIYGQTPCVDDVYAPNTDLGENSFFYANDSQLNRNVTLVFLSILLVIGLRALFVLVCSKGGRA